MPYDFWRNFLGRAGRAFIWVALIMGFVLVEGVATEANAVYVFSRSCSATIGINESGTWNLFNPLNSWHWARSFHFTKNGNNWNLEHKLDSGWNSSNGVPEPGGWKAIRSIAQHTGEWWLQGASVGRHYWWDWKNRKSVFFKRTQATWCADSIIGDPWNPPY